jgi:predicted metal-dependent HD superfamily phosphohydrolase
MVALKPPPGNPHLVGEAVKLLQGGVAHQMTPLATLEPPTGLIDQDRHRCSLPDLQRWHTGQINQDLITELRAIWQRSAATDQYFDELLARYREPHRRYHDLAHLSLILHQVQDLADHHPVNDLGAVVIAAFYHDAIYTPLATNNEQASADLARVQLAAMGWTSARIGHIAQMILATAGHSWSDDLDTCVLLDADLSILGTPPHTYQRYLEDLRQEYAAVAETQWRAGRGEFISAMLDRPAIFSTPLATQRWEATARTNLIAELAQMA